MLDREISPVWHDRFARLIVRNLPNLPEVLALDIHCGTGRGTGKLLHRLGAGAKILAIDPDEGALEMAKTRIRPEWKNRVYFKSGHFDDVTAMADDSYNLVVANLVLGESVDLEPALGEMIRVGKIGGRILATVPLHGTWEEVEDIFAEILRDAGMTAALRRLEALRAIRPTGPQLGKMLRNLGAVEDDYVIEHERFQLLFPSGREFLFAPVIEHGSFRPAPVAVDEDDFSDLNNPDTRSHKTVSAAKTAEPAPTSEHEEDLSRLAETEDDFSELNDIPLLPRRQNSGGLRRSPSESSSSRPVPAELRGDGESSAHRALAELALRPGDSATAGRRPSGPIPSSAAASPPPASSASRPPASPVPASARPPKPSRTRTPLPPPAGARSPTPRPPASARSTPPTRPPRASARSAPPRPPSPSGCPTLPPPASARSPRPPSPSGCPTLPPPAGARSPRPPSPSGCPTLPPPAGARSPRPPSPSGCPTLLPPGSAPSPRPPSRSGCPTLPPPAAVPCPTPPPASAPCRTCASRPPGRPPLPSARPPRRPRPRPPSRARRVRPPSRRPRRRPPSPRSRRSACPSRRPRPAPARAAPRSGRRASSCPAARTACRR
ncbi:methyltransferase domain-containing protein [Nannocystis pusilla]|uniref:Methyltransferase domain-containing protein n=1 Tax=Nannocystis pusilla TaxID=889268 RepID=A0A9X3J291_9BACT|nr:methyltransferase domain-containing protein [Nannocystis pusilla]